MRRVRVGNHRGIVLITSYLLLSLFLVYSNAMTIGTLTQRLAADRLRDRDQALDLAQGAMEQLREDLHSFLTTEVYQLTFQGDAIQALEWLDDLGRTEEVPLFDFPLEDTNGDGVVNWDDGADGIRDGSDRPGDSRRCITLSTPGAPCAWITKIESTNSGNPLAPRRVTIEAEASVGAITKKIRATFQIELGMADIFRNAYFVNNFGWFDTPGDSKITIRGEIRSNADLAFSGDLTDLRVLGDLYAAENPELINPKTLLQATGTITGDPGQYSDLSKYWEWKGERARPARRLTFPSQPAIGGTPKILDYGLGWNTESENFPDQQKFTSQPTHQIPYIGDLGFYKSLATQLNGSLTYKDPATGDTKTVTAVYAGPDGLSGTGDDQTPLVLIGTWSTPININGPVIIPGDVVIKGWVEGQGTIYAGRNTHLVGEVKYKNKPTWPSLERNTITGQIREACNASSNLGTVSDEGVYTPP